MMLYVNGDSNSAGAEMKNVNDCYANQLAQLLNATIVNNSYSGASNDRILRTTYKYLENNIPDLLVIGWTSSEREDWFIQNEYKSVNSFHVNTLDLERMPEWKEWSENKAGWLSNDYSYEKQLVKFWNSKIFNFHLELNYCKIPHFFFNAIYSFNVFGPVYEYPWGNAFYQPYNKNSAMIRWASAQGYEEITPGKSHFEKEAHSKWANVIYKHIKDNNLI